MIVLHLLSVFQLVTQNTEPLPSKFGARDELRVATVDTFCIRPSAELTCATWRKGSDF